MSLSVDWAAHALGMKSREIAAVKAERGGGHLVTTHDGQQVRLATDGVVTPVAASPQVPADTAETAEDTQAPAKRARAPRQAKGKGSDKGKEKGAESPEDGPQVPDGDADAVLAWVGQDPARLEAALVVERQRTEPRDELLDALELLADDLAGGHS